MGNFLSSIWKKIGMTNKEYRLLMLGLDAAGKTQILYIMKLGEFVHTIPTIGFNVETITVHGVDLTILDVCAQTKIRPLWRHYFENTNGVVWVVDSNDRERFAESREELERLMLEEELKDIVVAVFANKQDLPSAASVDEVSAAFEFDKMGDHTLCVFGTSAVDGTNIAEGMEWLGQEIMRKFG